MLGRIESPCSLALGLAHPRRDTARQRLKLLSCTSCGMEGAIPDSITTLSRLQWLSLDRNRFTSIPQVEWGLNLSL